MLELLAEKIKEDGKIEGIKEGEIKGKIEIVKNMLNEGLDANLIARIPGLSIEEIEKLK